DTKIQKTIEDAEDKAKQGHYAEAILDLDAAETQVKLARAKGQSGEKEDHETVKPLTTNEKENWTRKIQDGLGKNADSIKKLLQDMDGDQRLKQVGEGKNLKKGLAKQVLENEKHLEAVAADPDLCAELVSLALVDKDDKDLVCDRDRLKKGLGEHEAAVAT